MGVALANDVDLASSDAQFSLAFHNVGLILDYGPSYFVTQAIGPYKAKEIAPTDERIPGERADQTGLVNHAYPADELDEQFAEYVQSVAEWPTAALEFALRTSDRAARRTLEEAIEAVSEAQVFATGTDDHQGGWCCVPGESRPRVRGAIRWAIFPLATDGLAERRNRHLRWPRMMGWLPRSKRAPRDEAFGLDHHGAYQPR